MGACVIDGASWDVLGDFGAAPFILDRDLLNANPGSELTSAIDAATESIGDMLLSATWAWGASRGLGPLTEPSAGRAILSLLDTLRTFDPLNDDSPIAGYLKLNVFVRIMVDALPAFTGRLRAWSHDIGPAESTLELVDAIGEAALTDARPLSEVNAPDGPAEGWAPGAISSTSTFGSVKAAAALDASGAAWQDRLLTPDDDPAPPFRFVRILEAFESSSFLEQLQIERFAGHHVLYAMRDGFLTLADPTLIAPASSLTVNCGGVFLAELATLVDRGRVRNRVRVHPTAGADVLYDDVASQGRNGVHEVLVNVADVALWPRFGLADDPADFQTIADPYGRWAQEVLDELGEPAAMLALGTLRPSGATEVGKVARAESYDRWTVVHDHVVPPISRVVSVLGMRCRLTTTGLEADVTTEDVA